MNCCIILNGIRYEAVYKDGKALATINFKRHKEKSAYREMNDIIRRK